MLNFFHRGFRALQKAQQARADYWILTNMSDKELHDIGIARGDIRNVIAGSFKQFCSVYQPLFRSITHGLRVVTGCFSIVTTTAAQLRMAYGTTECTGLVITMYAQQRLSSND